MSALSLEALCERHHPEEAFQARCSHPEGGGHGDERGGCTSVHKPFCLGHKAPPIISITGRKYSLFLAKTPSVNIQALFRVSVSSARVR